MNRLYASAWAPVHPLAPGPLLRSAPGLGRVGACAARALLATEPPAGAAIVPGPLPGVAVP